MIVKMKKDGEKKWKTFNTEFEPLDIVASTVNTLNNIEGNNGIVLDMSYIHCSLNFSFILKVYVPPLVIS